MMCCVVWPWSPPGDRKRKWIAPKCCAGQHGAACRRCPRATRCNLFVEAMGPPASDADKWFISVLTTQGCAPCEKLKADWATNPWLLALADPERSQEVVGALQRLSARRTRARRSGSRSFRSRRFRRSWCSRRGARRYGDPQTVVYQGTYGGDPEKLARQITAAIRLYVSKLEPAPTPQPPVQQAAEGAGRIDPPWQPPPKIVPHLPDFLPVFPGWSTGDSAEPQPD